MLMKKSSNMLVILLGFIIVLGACSSDASEDLPAAISKFTTQYFPGLGVKSYKELPDDDSVVTLSGGPTITFDSSNIWIEIDGNGSPLPQVLIYDQLPPDLYGYLQGTEQQAEVRGVKRDRYYYKLTMLDTVISYQISDGKITYPGTEEYAII